MLAACGGSHSEPSSAAVLPIPPASLQATAGNAQVSLSWTASAGATSYHLKRGTTSGGPYAQVAAPTASPFVDSALANGTTYFYVVSALNAVGESANSTEASARPLAPPQVPPVPTGVTTTAGDAQVNLAWTASAGATR
jgi:cellulose 1,4-beta-cellobiosidase